MVQGDRKVLIPTFRSLNTVAARYGSSTYSSGIRSRYADTYVISHAKGIRNITINIIPLEIPQRGALRLISGYIS